MEAHGVREFPPGTRARPVRPPRAAAPPSLDVILPALQRAQLLEALRGRRGHPRPRRARARSTCRRAPTTAIVDPPTLAAAARDSGAQVLGDRRPRARSTTCSPGSIWIPDGELDALDRAAREYRRDHRRARPAASARPGDASRRGRGEPGDGRGRHRRGRRLERRRRAATTARAAAPASLGDALEQAIARAARRPARAARRGHRPADSCSQGGRRESRAGQRPRARHRAADRADARPRRRPPAVPRRGAARPPLRHPAAPGDHARATRIDKRTPGGRFDGRAYARGRAQRPTGRPVTTHPWRDHPAGHARRSRSRTSG